MKKILFTFTALVISLAAMAQFYVYKNGSVLYMIENGVADSISFTAPECFINSGVNGGHEYVDLGLSDGTLWATCNIGASNPEDGGQFFAWGETTSKTSFSWDNYKFGTEDNMTKYLPDSWGKVLLDDEDNAAIAHWGGKWTMPTESQLEVLYQECYWVWTANYNGSNKAGYIVYKAKEEKDKGKAVKSGEEPLSAYSLADVHIFLPAAGVYVGNELLGVGEYGCIWSLELPSSDENKSEHLGLGPEYIYYDFTERYKSNNIRPVIKQ